MGDNTIDYLPEENWAEPKDTHDRGIRSLEGLQYAINLEKLDLSENRIKDLTPLQNLKNLKYLELDRNILGDLTPLSNISSLEHLNIYNNENIVDTTPISGLTNLKWIDMHFCNRGKQTVNVEPLSKLVNLEYLSIESNFIEDISFAKNLKKLKSFSCAVNHVTDLSAVEDLSAVAWDDWNDDLFLNMYNQTLKEPVKISVDSKGTVYKMDIPVKGLDKYINKYIKLDMPDAQVPGVVFTDAEEDDFISVECNYNTNQIEITVKANESESGRKLQRNLFLDYDMYCLSIKVEVDQEGKTK